MVKLSARLQSGRKAGERGLSNTRVRELIGRSIAMSGVATLIVVQVNPE